MLFDELPMETLTKSLGKKPTISSQTKISKILKEHRHNYGTLGNCFDLALRLIHVFLRRESKLME